MIANNIKEPIDKKMKFCFPRSVSSYKRHRRLGGLFRRLTVSFVAKNESEFRHEFNNRMTLLILAIERIKLRNKCRTGTQGHVLNTTKIRMFLEELEDRTGTDSKECLIAIKWLRAYFTVYPWVTTDRCHRALEMARMLYQRVGLGRVSLKRIMSVQNSFVRKERKDKTSDEQSRCNA